MNNLFVHYGISYMVRDNFDLPGMIILTPFTEVETHKMISKTGN